MTELDDPHIGSDEWMAHWSERPTLPGDWKPPCEINRDDPLRFLKAAVMFGVGLWAVVGTACFCLYLLR